MIYDRETEWVSPVVNEVFLITDNGTPIMKVKCVEGQGSEKECVDCVWWNLCKKCDTCAGPFPCEASQRPDGKYVYFIKQEEF